MTPWNRLVSRTKPSIPMSEAQPATVSVTPIVVKSAWTSGSVCPMKAFTSNWLKSLCSRLKTSKFTLTEGVTLTVDPRTIGQVNEQGERVILELLDLYPTVLEWLLGDAHRRNVPVIVSKQSGAAEVLEHALKVDFWNVEEIASRILSVLRDPMLAEELAQDSLVAALEQCPKVVRDRTVIGGRACERLGGE